MQKVRLRIKKGLTDWGLKAEGGGAHQNMLPYSCFTDVTSSLAAATTKRCSYLALEWFSATTNRARKRKKRIWEEIFLGGSRIGPARYAQPG